MSKINIAEFREFLLRAKGQAEHIFSGEARSAGQGIDYLFVVLDTELLRQFKARETRRFDMADPVERDAARYRWLRDKERGVVGSPLWVADGEYYAYVGEDLDNAVDTAMQDDPV